MQCSTACRIAIIALCSSCAISAQTNPSTPPSPKPPSSSPSARQKPPKPKPTPQQEQGLRLLKSAEAASAGLEPAARVYVLWRVSNGYRKVDPARANKILRRAFTASRGIVDESVDGCYMEPVCHRQTWLQREILLEMMGFQTDKANPERIEKLLPQANPDVKKTMLELLAGVYLEKQNFDRVREIMDEMDDDRYSYQLAGDLMAALPDSRRDERMAVFSQAFQNFGNRTLDDVSPDHDDFGVLLLRFWRDLPPSLALDAVDTTLERSKDRDESKKVHNVSLTLLNGKSMPFNSEYEFRLFQLLPILQELDSSKAEHLLDEHDSARRALNQYPSGMQSLDPNYYSDKPTDQNKLPAVWDVTTGVSDDPATNSAYQLDQQIRGQMQGVRGEIEQDPEQAYQDAMNLPLRYALDKAGSPRATALKWVAMGVGKKNSTLARSAMNEARRLAQDVDPPRQALILAEVPDFYLKLGDEDGARGAIKDEMKLADRIYAIDTDSDDPNLAFKGAWPSANTWRVCIEEAAKVSPAFAEELLAQIPDPEIASLQRVMYANVLLGAGKTEIAVFEWHKGGRKSGVSMMTQ
jgi:hypothetical protein